MLDFGLGKLRLWSAAAASAGLFMTQAAGAHPAAFTLSDVMQAPFPSYLVAAPTGAAVAWVFNTKGCSNIWVADPSHGAKARQITPYTEDDGFDIGELAWSPDTKSIAFTRGENLWDENPVNVNSSPEGPACQGDPERSSSVSCATFAARPKVAPLQMSISLLVGRRRSWNPERPLGQSAEMLAVA